jgi:hypothetical protein
MADGNREVRKKRKCLMCDQEFLSRWNRICPRCHYEKWKLFRTAPGPNYENLIYIDIPEDDMPEEGK